MLKKLGIICIVGGALVSTALYVACLNDTYSYEAKMEQLAHEKYPDSKEFGHWKSDFAFAMESNKRIIFEESYARRRSVILGGRLVAFLGFILFALGYDMDRRAIIGLKREERDATGDRECRP